MHHAAIKSSLKRGALITAANWEVVVIQFVAESAFKALLMVPVVGAAFLLALLVGGGVFDVLDGGIQDALGSAITGLREHPGALVAYLTGLLIVVVGGSTLMFRIKGGTVRVLVEAEREAPAIEQPPLTLARVRQAARFSLDRFGEGSDRFARRFLRLGLLLLRGVRAERRGVPDHGAGRVPLDDGSDVDDRRLDDRGGRLAGSSARGSRSSTCCICCCRCWSWPTTGRCAPRRGRCRRCSVRERRLIGGIFLVMLALVVLATVASVLATAALGFIGFVPDRGTGRAAAAVAGLARARPVVPVPGPGRAWRLCGRGAVGREPRHE